jgi:hypothetical protein
LYEYVDLSTYVGFLLCFGLFSIAATRRGAGSSGR